MKSVGRHLAREEIEAGLDTVRLCVSASVVRSSKWPISPTPAASKLVERFGLDAMKFVNSPIGRALHLRGTNARVVLPGTVRAGDRVTILRRGAGAAAQQPA
jgi:hypothetical protein